MAYLAMDRCRDITTTTGTGAVTVSGVAPIGYETFSQALSVGDTFLGRIAHQSANEWEIGLYTYSSANVVTRTTILASSNAGSAVNFSAGTKDVVLTQTAARGLLTTDITVPKIVGGDQASSSLILQSTSGAGSSDFVSVRTGNSGIEGLKVDTNQHVLLKNGGQNLTDTWATWSPTITSEGGGTFTTTASNCRYWRCGKLILVQGEMSSTNIGSAVGDVVRLTPPPGIDIAEQSVGPMWDRNSGTKSDGIVHAQAGDVLRLCMMGIGAFHNDMTMDFNIGFFTSSAG